MSTEFDTMIRHGNWLVLDTETTGLKRPAEICQIAIVDSRGSILFDSLIRPTMDIPLVATNVHGISNDMVANAPRWIQVQPRIAQIITGRDVITYNAEYDEMMIHLSDAASGLHPDYRSVRWWCAMKWYAEVWGEINQHYGTFVWQKLTEATQQQGLRISNAHTALGDAQMTLNLIRHVVKQRAAPTGITSKILHQPISRVYALFPEDKADNTIVEIRQATQGDKERRDSSTFSSVRIHNGDGIPLNSDWTDQQCLEAFLTMADCNIQVEEGGSLFRFENGRFAGTLEQFGKVWATLPMDWADTIHRCVLEVNPQFRTNNNTNKKNAKIRCITLFPEEPRDNTSVAVRKAAQSDLKKWTQHLKGNPITDGEDTPLESGWTMLDQKRLECWLSLADCNIRYEDGGSVFRFENGRYAGTFEDFGTAWSQLPIDWAERIHHAVLEVNPVFRLIW